MLERNKELESSLKQQQAVIDDQAQEIEVRMVVLVMVMSVRVAMLDNAIIIRYKVGDLSWGRFNSSIAWRATSFSSMS